MKKVYLAAFFITSFYASAQLRIGLESNNQYYRDDNKIKLDSIDALNRYRSNTYLKADYQIKHFEFGAQLEGYLPKAILNYNPELEGLNLGTAYARYNNIDKGVDITLGHFYEQFGSGLPLRFWEDRALGLNNALLGARFKYNFQDYANITMLVGKQRIGFGLDLAESLVYGTNIDVNISKILEKENFNLIFGTSFVGRYEDLTEKHPLVEKTTDIWSSRLDFSSDKFNFNVEYSYKTPDAPIETRTIFEDKKLYGNAFLANLGFNNNGFGINLNLRRLQNFAFYSERSNTGNIYNIGSINYIPALTKQYDHSLQNIYVYQAQPHYNYYMKKKMGEIGGQLDMYYEIPKETFFGGKYGANININGSYWAGLKTIDNKEEEVLDTEFFSFGKKYYKDIAVEYRRKFSNSFTSIFSYLNQYYNKEYVEDSYGQINAHTATAEGTYFLSETKSIRLELQHQWADYDRKNWAGGTVEFTPNPTWSFFVHDIYNYGNDDEKKQIHYYSIGGAFTKGATRVAASYGRQRGGIMCVGGVCRYVPESAGFSLNLTTNF